MSKPNYLSKAPIKEAAFGINFDEPVSLDFWDSIIIELKDLFPKKTNRNTFVFGFNQEPNKVKVDGYYLKDSNNRITLQLLKTGFVLSFGKPYEGWEKSYKSFDTVLRLTLSSIVKVNPKILSVKYVNRMNFTKVEFIEYFQLFNAKPIYPSLSKDVSNYQMHVSEKLPQNTKTNFISNSTECGSDENVIHLDTHISVVREINKQSNFENIGEEFDDLRKIKNEIFFNSFDNKILKQYE